jgi:hypothetical protein
VRGSCTRRSFILLVRLVDGLVHVPVRQLARFPALKLVEEGIKHLALTIVAAVVDAVPVGRAGELELQDLGILDRLLHTVAERDAARKPRLTAGLYNPTTTQTQKRRDSTP